MLKRKRTTGNPSLTPSVGFGLLAEEHLVLPMEDAPEQDSTGAGRAMRQGARDRRWKKDLQAQNEIVSPERPSRRGATE